MFEWVLRQAGLDPEPVKLSLRGQKRTGLDTHWEEVVPILPNKQYRVELEWTQQHHRGRWPPKSTWNYLKYRWWKTGAGAQDLDWNTCSVAYKTNPGSGLGVNKRKRNKTKTQISRKNATLFHGAPKNWRVPNTNTTTKSKKTHFTKQSQLPANPTNRPVISKCTSFNKSFGLLWADQVDRSVAYVLESTRALITFYTVEGNRWMTDLYYR